MRFSTLAATAVAVGAFATGSVQAAPLPVIGGITSVTLTSAPVLTTAGVSVGTLGSALLSPGSNGIPLVYFPVTGGNIDTGTFAGTVAHNGSGLSLTSGGTTLNLTDFLIDTVALTLTGQASVGGSSLGAVPLFTLGASGNAAAPFSLSLTSAAAGAPTSLFGLPDLTGLRIGDANTIPITAAVPEPASWMGMLAGIGLIGLQLAKRRGAAAKAEPVAA